MELIEDHQPDAAQFGIVLDHPRQNAFSHYLQSRIRSDAGFRAHPVADGRPRFLTQQLRQTLCHVAGG